MAPPAFHSNPAIPLIIDTSTVINLNGTGCATDIIQALPNRLVAVDKLPEELELGRERGRTDADLFATLVSEGLVHLVAMSESSEAIFESLVSGPGPQTLDDGEAAAISHAVSENATVVIDERKAIKLCTLRFPNLQLASTTDLFAHPAIKERLGGDGLAVAVRNALLRSKMSVLAHYHEWVIDLIGIEAAGECPSLPRRLIG